MNDWSRNLFGAAIFFGAGVMMLAGRVSEWWSIVSLIVMFVAAALFLVRSVIEYRRMRRADRSSEPAEPQQRIE